MREKKREKYDVIKIIKQKHKSVRGVGGQNKLYNKLNTCFYLTESLGGEERTNLPGIYILLQAFITQLNFDLLSHQVQ